jgi:hypothetical protein
MRKVLLTVASAGAMVLLTESAFALCAPNAGGAMGGAAVGATAGAVVGGPVGAAVGGAIGGAAGAAATPPEACSYVIEEEVPVTTIESEVVVGEPLPEVVVLHPIPDYDTYVFANVNGHRVLVDPSTRVVVEVVN